MLHRRAIVLWTLGQHAAALDDLRRAISVLQRGRRPAVDGAGAERPRAGATCRSARRAAPTPTSCAAGRLYAGTGQELEAVHPVLNRGLAAFAAGDLPTALSFLDEAAARYRPLNVPTPALSIDRCGVLLAAGPGR